MIEVDLTREEQKFTRSLPGSSLRHFAKLCTWRLLAIISLLYTSFTSTFYPKINERYHVIAIWSSAKSSLEA